MTKEEQRERHGAPLTAEDRLDRLEPIVSRLVDTVREMYLSTQITDHTPVPWVDVYTRISGSTLEFDRADIVIAQLPGGSMRTIKNRYGKYDILTASPVRLLAMRRWADDTWTCVEIPLNKETR